MHASFADLGKADLRKACCTHLIHFRGSKIECRHPVAENRLLSTGDICVGFRLKFNLIKMVTVLNENDAANDSAKYAPRLTLSELLGEEVTRLAELD